MAPVTMTSRYFVLGQILVMIRAHSFLKHSAVMNCVSSGLRVRYHVRAGITDQVGDVVGELGDPLNPRLKSLMTAQWSARRVNIFSDTPSWRSCWESQPEPSPARHLRWWSRAMINEFKLPCVLVAGRRAAPQKRLYGHFATFLLGCNTLSRERTEEDEEIERGEEEDKMRSVWDMGRAMGLYLYRKGQEWGRPRDGNRCTYGTPEKHCGRRDCRATIRTCKSQMLGSGPTCWARCLLT